MALGDVSFLEIPVDLPESFPSAYFHISSLRCFYLWVHLVRFYFNHFYHTLFPLGRDVLSDSLPSVCFSFLITLFFFVAVSTGYEGAIEDPSVILVDEVWTSTSQFSNCPTLSWRLLRRIQISSRIGCHLWLKTYLA